MITVYDMTSGTLQREPEASGMETMQEPVRSEYEMFIPELQLQETGCAPSQETIPASVLMMEPGRFVDRMK